MQRDIPSPAYIMSIVVTRVLVTWRGVAWRDVVYSSRYLSLSLSLSLTRIGTQEGWWTVKKCLEFRTTTLSRAKKFLINVEPRPWWSRVAAM